MMSLRKTIWTISEDRVSTEHPGKTFQEVYSEYKDQNVDMLLVLNIDRGNGWEFYKEAVIGNCRHNIDQSDYYQAYDKIV